MRRKGYQSALDFYPRVGQVHEKTFGEGSDKVADGLRLLATVYIAQGAYDKAEPYLLRAVRIDESFVEQDRSGVDIFP